jgi:hypothetical protein
MSGDPSTCVPGAPADTVAVSAGQSELAEERRAHVDGADLRNTVRAASEAGLVAVTEGFAAFREALPEETRAHAEQALGGASPVRRRAVALAEVAVDRAEDASRRAAHRFEAARVQLQQRADDISGDAEGATSPTSVVDEAASAVVVKEAVVEESRSGGSFWKMALAVVAIGAAAGAGYAVYAKRRSAARKGADTEGDWSAPPAAAGGFVPGMADTQSPDVVDEAFARDVDAAADELAEDIVEAVEGPLDEGVEAAPGEHFEPGMADTQSPDVVDDDFAAQVDAVAEEMAGDIIDAIEEPKQ